MRSSDWVLTLCFAAFFLTMPLWGQLVGFGYPAIMQKFAIFGLVALGYNLLFGLTGYLSFGHAAFIGVGSYAAVWTYKLFSMDIILALIMSTVLGGIVALILGFVALRRSGIYFSILTLAFAQMMYALAYSVLTPITQGETGLQLAKDDARVLDRALGINPAEGLPSPTLLGIGGMDSYNGYWVCAILLILGFIVALRITRSSFGTMLRGIKSNQMRMSYTGLSARPYLITVFVISGMYSGLAGGLMATVSVLAGAERMDWVHSGEIVIMTILGGVGTLFGPVLGAGIIKWLEAQISTIGEKELHNFFSFLPDGLEKAAVWIGDWFTGDAWHLTMGLVFMLVVIFLPGGIMEGLARIGRRFTGSRKS